MSFGRWLALPVVVPRWMPCWCASGAWRRTLQKAQPGPAANAGHVYFYMTPGRRASMLDSDGSHRMCGPEASPYNFSDLFSAKGLLPPPTTWRMRTPSEARSYCPAVYAILDRALPATNPSPRPWPGPGSPAPSHPARTVIPRRPQATLFVCEPGPQAGDGAELATHVWQRHVNVNGKWPELREFDLTSNSNIPAAISKTAKLLRTPGLPWSTAGSF